MSKLFRDAGGDLVEVIKVEGGVVHFCSQGGGFEWTTPEATFASDFTPATPTWKQVRVTGDWCDPGESYPAWWDGTQWNGWLAPHVTYDEILRMAKGSSPNLHQRLILGQLCWCAAQGDDTEDYDVFTPEQIDVEAQPVYRMVGWCWELADEGELP